MLAKCLRDILVCTINISQNTSSASFISQMDAYGLYPEDNLATSKQSEYLSRNKICSSLNIWNLMLYTVVFQNLNYLFKHNSWFEISEVYGIGLQR